MNEYSRTELLIGEEGLGRLKQATVMVFGVGGVGSHCIEALARSGAGRLILIDNDKVSLTNINRQSIAYHSTIGRMKTEVMRERIRDINPEIVVKTYETFVLPDNVEELFEETPDYIIDAIDTVTAKLAIAELAQRREIPLISSMGTGNKLDPGRFRITDIEKTKVCPLAKVIRKELKKRGVRGVQVLYSEEEPVKTGMRTPASISFVPSAAGLMIAGEVVRYFSDR